MKQNKNYTMTAIGEIDVSNWDKTPRLQMIVKGYELQEKTNTAWSIYDF